ncbi:MAG TPA: GDSL-type esterase/lipase family protein, partial [Thermoanaerobaculia bacterium]|nr:GDSL-type esterase/lipase family protein [Thermoanaerobaculia bacterium]
MQPPSRLTHAFALLASVCLVLAAACAFGWWRAAHRERLGLDSLGPEERQALLDEMIAVSPGAFAPAYFEPAVGYTLRRGKITAWTDTFRANEIGYRTVSLTKAKPAGTFRVVFLGDSWTFGLGIREAETFPRRFEEIARQLGAGGGRRVQAVNLGMPGYNTANEIAALDFFWERVRPDAVVLCPTGNDADSSANVLANGSLTRQGVERDAFGEDHSLVFRAHLVDSFKFRRRWRANFQAIRELEARLRARGVPLVLFFTATWDEPFAHALVREAGLTTPYVVTPRVLASPRWRNPAPWGHGNASANRLYGAMVYKLVAETLGWPAAPAPDV